MSGFFEEFMGSYNPFDSAGYDEQVIMRNSLFAVVPKIAKNELTQMQRICFEMFYFEKKNQKQIAAVLHISQPSVCRHLKSAKMIIEKIGGYCILSIKKTNEQWEKLQLLEQETVDAPMQPIWASGDTRYAFMRCRNWRTT